MAITLVSADYLASGFATTSPCVMTTNPVAGRFILVMPVWNGSGVNAQTTVTDLLGTTYTKLSAQYSNGSDMGGSLWWGIAPAGGANTVTSSFNIGPFIGSMVWSFDGVDQTTPIDGAVQAAVSAASNLLSTISITPSVANCLVFGGFHGNSTTSPTVASPFTLSNFQQGASWGGNSGGGGGAGYEIQTTATTRSSFFTAPSQEWVGIVVAIRAAGAATTSAVGGAIGPPDIARGLGPNGWFPWQTPAPLQSSEDLRERNILRPNRAGVWPGPPNVRRYPGGWWPWSTPPVARSTQPGTLRQFASADDTISTTAGALSVARAVAGLDASISSVSSSVAVTRALVAADASVSALAAALRASRAYVGADASLSTLTAALRVLRAYTGTDASTSGEAGALDTTHANKLLVGADASVSAVSAALRVSRILVAADASVSALSGVLAVQRRLAASPAAVSALTAALRVARAYSGADASVSSITAALTSGVRVDAVAGPTRLFFGETRSRIWAPETRSRIFPA